MNSLEEAVKSLATICDGAASKDQAGFNKIDAPFGHKLVSIPVAAWTSRQHRAAWAMLRKYRGQLGGLGIDYDAIPEPPTNLCKSKPTRLLTIDDAGYVRVYFPYDAALVAAVKTVPGARFDGQRKNWWAKLTRDNAEAIMRFAVDEDFEFGDKLMSAVDALFTEYAENLEASRAKKADLEIPGLGGVLRPFQKAGVVYAIRAKRTFLCDEMGLGKTVESLAVIQAEQAYPAVIVCPASLKLNWRREAEKWLPGRRVAIVNGKKNGECWDGADIVILNYDVLKKNLEALQGLGLKAVVFDESHYCKNYKAQRTEAAKTLAKGIPIILALSGTPVLNRPQELLSQLQIIRRLDEMGGFWPFAQRYCKAHKTRFGWDFSGSDHLDELNTRMRATCYVRRTKEEVLTELPPKTRAIVPIEITNRQEYNQAEADVVRWLGSQATKEEAFLKTVASCPPEERARAIADHRMSAEATAARAEQLVRIESLKQLSAQGKMEAIGEWVESFLETGEKLVIFAHHHSVVEELAQRFNNAPSITGQTPVERRQEYVDRFQTDPACRVIVCNIKAGGVGLTLTAASNVLFCELEWTPAAHDQATDRVHRIGQTDSVTAWYLLGQGTIDEEIMSLIDSKRTVVDAATEGQEPLEDIGIMAELVKRLSKGKGEDGKCTRLSR